MNETPSKGARPPKSGYRLRLENLEANQAPPEIVVVATDQNNKPVYTAKVDRAGAFDLPPDVLKKAHRIVVRSANEELAQLDPKISLRLRPEDFASRVAKEGILDIASHYWERWFPFITCVHGSVRRCLFRPWWLWEQLQPVRPLPILRENVASIAKRTVRTPLLSAREQLANISIADAIRPIHVFRCATICDGTVEVYRRTCCCRPWILDDPRLPELIRDLEDIIRRLPEIKIPRPPIPDPPPFQFLSSELPFFKEGALDERAVNAMRDLEAIRTLPKFELPTYIEARPYLWHCSCGASVKVGQGTIDPDGTFSICWLDFRRVSLSNCYEEYAYVVKQVINGVTVTIYNGLAANIWFRQDADADLVSYDARARACRDNGARDDAYIYLELIGDTEAWHLKTPDSTGWDQVDTPAFNDGLVFPSDAPADASAPYDRNWGGTLKLYYKFSEGMKDVGAKYYRLSVTAANDDGEPVGTRFYYGSGLSWEKSISGGVTVPVTLGPFTEATENNLYLIPYDSDADWDADQYHAYLNTNDVNWNNPEVRHLLTLEVFDAAGHRLRPNGTPASSQPGTEHTAPFTYRRQFQDLGPSANVPFAALTHMFWWDNRPAVGDIVYLIKNGLEFDEECQYLQGQADSTFGVGYRAYHPNPLFQYFHQVSWYRGSGATAGSTDILTSSSANVGKPPDPPGPSGTHTFAHLLRTDLDATRLKCSFAAFLNMYVKTFDGENTLSGLNAWDAWAFSVEINA